MQHVFTLNSDLVVPQRFVFWLNHILQEGTFTQFPLCQTNTRGQYVITARKRSLRRLCFTGVCLSTGGGLAWLPGRCAWLLGGMCGCGGACVVAGGCVWLLGACMIAGGCAWLLGGLHGCWGACVVARGHAWLLGGCMVARGMHGCQGACVVAGGCAWLPGACMVKGVMCGEGGACVGYNEIRRYDQ